MKTDHIKNRNMLMQVVLMIVTFGLYSIYWYYSTLKELHTANGNDEGAAKWTFFLFLPILNLFTYWHHANECAEFTRNKYPALLVFLAWMVFSPIVWFLIQTELNQAADASAQPASA